MSEFPAMRAWENFPPPGGWSVEVEIGGHRFRIRGGPHTILRRYMELAAKNGESLSLAQAQKNLNVLWCERDPARCRMPGLAAMAKGLAGAVAGEAKALLRGSPRVTEAEVKRRLAICEGCQYYRRGRCGKCGCVMNLKSRLRSAHCPIKKW